MFITTHRCIGKLVYNYLMEYHNLKLDQRALKLGCMIPDLPFNRIRFPHYKTDSFHSICLMINQLCTTGNSLHSRQQVSHFSKQLGIILHYIADFFCEAHNFSAYHNLAAHLYYEQILSDKFEKTSISEMRTILKTFKNAHLSTPKSRLSQYINDRHFEYLNAERSMQTDLYYSLCMCINVGVAIINVSAGNENHFIRQSSGVA